MLLPNKAVWLNEKMLLLKIFELEQNLEVAQESLMSIIVIMHLN